MTREIDTEAFASKTGRTWEGWLDFLEAIDANALSHAEIARRVKETGDATGWWAQSITVAYERHIGRRAPGQRTDGHFEVSVSKTVSGDMDRAFETWQSFASALSAVDGVGFEGGPRTNATEKWRYWRRGLADGSGILVTVADKPGGKAGVTVTHEKLASADDKERWRSYWKSALTTLETDG